MSGPSGFRLPTSVFPESYDLHLDVDPDRSTFNGTARIELVVDEPVQEVVLHGRDLVVDEVDFFQGEKEAAGTVIVDKENEALRIRPSRPLDKGRARLEVLYSGKVSRSMQGLYLAKDGKERCLVTQCEATDARAVFPCFDEPAFKARLKWTVTAPPGLHVLSNGVLEEREDREDGKTTWRFAATPPISTYLAAIAVGPFEATKVRTERGVPHRVWALGGKHEYGRHARDFAARCQAWYEDYFDVKYRFKAYDQVAVPSFAFGAMENPGLVVFRPSLLLLDGEKATWRERKQVDRVVAHEAAHMWFGNHVTMQWWDDLWLNEAFAEWIAHKCVDELEPTSDVWTMFQGATDGALATDALSATHPIHVDVKTPQEAQEIFDAITYGKGSAVMRMIEDFLGADAFRSALREYMAEFGAANARGKDLWRHLAGKSGHRVDQIMQEWVSRPGHPLLRAELHGGDDSDGCRLLLRQERAFVLAEGDADAARDAPWPVPVVVRYRDREAVKEHRHLLQGHEETIALDAHGEVAWCVVNARGAGFYRVAPEPHLRDRLSSHYVEMEVPERRGFLRDLWFLVKRRELQPGVFLDVVADKVPKETHYAVTQDLVGYVRGVERMLEQAGAVETLGDMRAWVVNAFSPQLERLGIPTDPAVSRRDPEGAERRAAVFNAVAGVGMDRDAVLLAHEIAAREREDPHAVEPEVAQAAVRLALMHGGGDHFAAHVETYRTRRDSGMAPQLVERYLYSLPATRDDELVRDVLALCGDGTVPAQGVGPILRIMLVEPHAQESAWEYVRGHWDTLRKTIGDAWCPILVEHLGHLPPHLHDEARRFMDAMSPYARESRKRAAEMLLLVEGVQEHVVPGIVDWVAAKTP